MTRVGICRIVTTFSIIAFILFLITFTEYNFMINHESIDNIYPNDIIYAMLYVIPGLIVLSYILLLSTYTMCIIIKPRNIPDQYSLSTVEIANFMIQPNVQGNYHAVAELTREYIKTRPGLQVRERDYRHGGLRICEICSIIKPDRSHHCAICKRCVLRMDHHCHWVNNCIHADNHKYFLQSITLGVIIGCLVLVHCGININCGCATIPDPKEELYFGCILLYVGTGFASIISLFLVFLTLDHCTNLFRGQTSYERVYDRDHYNRGWKRNFCDVMGITLCQWLCPVTPTKLIGEREPLIVTVEDPSSGTWFATTENLQTKADNRSSIGSPAVARHYSMEETLSLRHGESVLSRYSDTATTGQSNSVRQESSEQDVVAKIRDPHSISGISEES